MVTNSMNTQLRQNKFVLCEMCNVVLEIQTVEYIKTKIDNTSMFKFALKC